MSASPRPSVVFLLGVPRSGTTLFRVMLAGHPELWSPPEMVLAPFTTMAERRAALDVRFWEKGGLRRALMDLEGLDAEAARAREDSLEGLTVDEAYAFIRSRLGNRLLVDKCPHLAANPEPLARLAALFPDARYLLIVRHPGSVIRSLENMPMAEVMLQGFEGGAQDVWYRGNQAMQAFLDTIPPSRWARVRYEDLVKSPRAEMERVLTTLGLAWDERVIDPYEGDRMREGPKGARAIGDPNMASRGRIQPELAEAWLEGFDAARLSPEARQLAESFGYDLASLPVPPMRTLDERLGSLFAAAQELSAGIDMPADIDGAEGRRFVLRMLTASLDMMIEEGDADRPVFHHSEGPTRKMFADNPDADYLRAPVKLGGCRAYRVWGRVPPGTLYVGVLLYGRGGRISRRLVDHQLGIDAEGKFSLMISVEEQAGVWLRAEGDETAVMVRQYFGDRRKERPIEVHIALAGEVPLPAPLGPRPLIVAAERAERMLRTIVKRTREGFKLATTAALNRFITIEGEAFFPTPDNRYQLAWYRFGGDQVMFLRGRIPKSRYFSITLYNAWMESLDYRYHRVSLHAGQMVLEPDGSFEVVLAHRDPRHENWIETAGHHAGYVLARALLPEEDLGEIQIQVMYEKEWSALRAERKGRSQPVKLPSAPRA